jgi:transposase InsO family protein
VAKLARTVSRKLPTTPTTRKLELVHSDVGTMPIASVGGSKYYLTFTDDKTRYKWTLLMKKKSEVEITFYAWKQRVENEAQQQVLRFRTDGGGEYTSTSILKFLFTDGTKHEKTPAYTPEMNGVSERLNRTLVEATKAMLYEAELDDSWWGEAIMTATYLRNLIPTKMRSLEGERMTTPFQEWKGIRPNLQHLRIFGSECWVHIPKQLRKKLDDHAKKGVFVGYGDTQNTYRVAVGDRVSTYRDIRFNETL